MADGDSVFFRTVAFEEQHCCQAMLLHGQTSTKASSCPQNDVCAIALPDQQHAPVDGCRFDHPT